jgi:hypothetical protein
MVLGASSIPLIPMVRALSQIGITKFKIKKICLFFAYAVSLKIDSSRGLRNRSENL